MRLDNGDIVGRKPWNDFAKGRAGEVLVLRGRNSVLTPKASYNVVDALRKEAGNLDGVVTAGSVEGRTAQRANPDVMILHWELQRCRQSWAAEKDDPWTCM